MITKTQLSDIIKDQQKVLLKKGWIERQTKIPLHSKRIVIISGVRRCGKSTLLKQKLLKTNTAIYVNFEDPRLINFSVEDFTKLEQLSKDSAKSNIILDEVQNIEKWELFARMANEKGIPLFITGSNASMLSRELGTHLTGRYNQIELFPFSFDEFLDFFKLERSLNSFSKYFEYGGFPEFLDERDNEYHRTLLRDIVTRDIAVRRNISNENQLIRLAVHLLSNTGKEFSYNNLAKILEFKSVRTVIDYCAYFRESYIMDYIPIFSHSIKKQLVNPKKVYSIDPVFAQANSLSFSKDIGRRLENFVFNKLRRQHHEIYYHKHAKTECDFLIKQNEKIELAVQSCWEINQDNMAREVNGLKNAIKETKANEGVIITHDQEDNLDGIPLIPAYKWI